MQPTSEQADKPEQTQTRQTKPTGITAVCQGRPRPQPRPRFVNGKVVSTADANARLWTVCVDRGLKQASDIVGGRDAVKSVVGTGPLTVRLQFRMPFDPLATPSRRKGKTVGGPHAMKPDTDNLAKLVLDRLTKASFVPDDALVASLVVDKVWSRIEDQGVTVWVQPYEPVFQPSGGPERAGYAPSADPTPPAWVKTLLRAGQ
jgi:Holliday junction resolvase RusA-like endonuclease